MFTFKNRIIDRMKWAYSPTTVRLKIISKFLHRQLNSYQCCQCLKLIYKLNYVYTLHRATVNVAHLYITAVRKPCVA